MGIHKNSYLIDSVKEILIQNKFRIWNNHTLLQEVNIKVPPSFSITSHQLGSILRRFHSKFRIFKHCDKYGNTEYLFIPAYNSKKP